MYIKKSTQEILLNSTEKLVEIKSQFLRLLPFWVAGCLTSLAATFYAKLFSFAESIALQLYNSLSTWFLLIPPVFFVLSWFFVHYFAPGANGSGIPQLMASIELVNEKQEKFVQGLLGFRIILVKVVSSILGLLGGGAIGREGPTLQISGSIFFLFTKYWKISDIQNKSSFLIPHGRGGLRFGFGL